MDVNNQVLTFVNTYGGSENTSPGQLAASKALNYAVGPSMGNPVVELVKGIPFTIKLKGELGMSGVENLYVKVNMDVSSLSSEGNLLDANNWVQANIVNDNTVYANWTNADWDRTDSDIDPSGNYTAAEVSTGLYVLDDPHVGIQLTDKGTGNVYNDKWIDARLYTSEREEHPYDDMFVRGYGSFYIGIHARNTRRYEYNVECLIGSDYKDLDDLTAEERSKVARLHGDDYIVGGSQGSV